MDVISTVVIRKNAVPGDGLLSFIVNPGFLRDTRLSMYSRMWSRWRPKKLVLEVSPAAGLMIPGSYVAAWSADPNERLPSGVAAIAHLVALGCQVQNPIGVVSRLNIPCSATARWYVMNGEAVDDAHGSVHAVLAGSLGAVDVAVTFKLHWTIEFNGPNLEAPGEEMYTEPEAGWENIFTDSVSDWQGGKKLTFKHAEGGTVVPWTNLKSMVVYTPTKGVSITYKTEKGESKTCSWFSRIKDSPDYPNALCCHASEDAAQSYQRTGDVTKVLTYYAAGDWAVPALPRLVGQPVPMLYQTRVGPATLASDSVEEAVLRVLARLGIGVPDQARAGSSLSGEGSWVLD